MGSTQVDVRRGGPSASTIQVVTTGLVAVGAVDHLHDLIRTRAACTLPGVTRPAEMEEARLRICTR